MGIELVAFSVVILTLGYLVFKGRKVKQLAYIRNYTFPKKIALRIKEEYPHLNDEDVEIVFDALRDYFHICNIGKTRVVSMPSQVVDLAWHEFILFTRNYQSFCNRAIGRFLHHIPTEAMESPTLAQEGIKRTWRLACAKEKMSPATPSRLPLLFAIDGKLKIEDGFKYSLNCQVKSSLGYGRRYCAGHIGCAAGCAGDSGSSSNRSGGFSDRSGDSFDSSGGSGGGGCGGGGD